MADFDADLVSEVKELVKKPLKDIYPVVRQWLDDSMNLNHVCLLRYILEQPPTPEIASLVGYYALNNMIPTPTLYTFMFLLLDMRREFYGEQCCIAFLKSVLPALYKFPWFAHSVITNPGFGNRNVDLYIALLQLLETPLSTNAHLHKSHYAIPEAPQPISVKMRTAGPKVPLERAPNEPPIRMTLADCVTTAYSLFPNHQHYLISCLLSMNAPEDYPDEIPPIVIETLAYYIRFIMHDYYVGTTIEKQGGWQRFNDHVRLQGLGRWIGLVSLRRGRPPPVHLLDMVGLLKDAISNGFLAEYMNILIGYYMRMSPRYAVPCPYTVHILEILAGVHAHREIRTDVRRHIEDFAHLLNTRIEMYYSRQVKIPPTSNDLHAQFIQEPHTKLFYLAKYSTGATISFDQERAEAFFNFQPTSRSLPSELRELVLRAEHTERYYFLGSGDPIPPPDFGFQQALFDNIIMIGMAASPVVADTAGRLLETLDTANFSTASLRYAFPNRYIFRAVVHRGAIEPTELNSYFCDIITNPQLEERAVPALRSLMPLLFRVDRIYLTDKTVFNSIYTLTGMRMHDEQYHIPPPDPQHAMMLRPFVDYCRTGDPAAMMDFCQKFQPGTNSQIAAFTYLLIGSCGFKSDYSVIDMYETVLNNIQLKVRQDSFIPGALKAIEALTKPAIDTNQRPIFRFLWSTLTTIEVPFNPARLIPFFEKMSPGAYPQFATCWMQLVLHPRVFIPLVEAAEPTTLPFCIRFVVTVLRMAVIAPSAFYKAAVRMLHILNAQVPVFIASYHLYFLDVLPRNCIQLRNLICSASPPNPQTSLPPPCGVYSSSDSPDMKACKIRIDAFTGSRTKDTTLANAKFVQETVKHNFEKERTMLSRLTHYFLSNIVVTSERVSATSPATDFALVMAEADGDFINCMLDHVRFRSTHTRVAGEILANVFYRARDDVKEALLTAICARLLCVTQPPHSVRELLDALTTDRGADIVAMFRRIGSYIEFERAMSAIRRFK